MPAHEFSDILIVYASPDDPGRYVAHSLRTDQIGVGDDPFEAVVELAQAVRDLLEEASRDGRVLIERPAPEEVMRRLPGAKHLTDENWRRIQHVAQLVPTDEDYWELDDGTDLAAEAFEGALWRSLRREDLLVPG